MNFNIFINDIDESVPAGVIMMLVGRLINRIKTEKEKYGVGWYHSFRDTNQNSIIKRGIIGLNEDSETYYIVLNPPDEDWEIAQNNKITHIEDLLQSGIERRGG